MQMWTQNSPESTGSTDPLVLTPQTSRTCSHHRQHLCFSPRSCLSPGPAPLSPSLLSGSITLHHQPELWAPGHPSQPALTSGGQVSQTAWVRRGNHAGTSEPDPMSAFPQSGSQFQSLTVLCEFHLAEGDLCIFVL